MRLRVLCHYVALFESITSVEVQLELEVGDARIRQLGVG